MAHLYLSAAHKSSGKTTIAVGLAAALTERGLSVQTFKKGPDYIDPMWLQRAARRPCYNLDYNVQSGEEISATFATRMQDAALGLIEGNKGLFDGLDVQGSDSNAALAKLLGAPVILVIDCEGMTRGIAPLILGYRAFDPDVAINGVILNRVAGSRHEGKLRAALERYTDVPVLGAVQRDQMPTVEERHLGLTTPAETDALDDVIQRIATCVSAGVDLDALLEIAEAAPRPQATKQPQPATQSSSDIRIAIARDAAFGFYYADDLEALSAAGAELVPFNTLSDPELPDADGLLLGGGFPETQMAGLEANASLRAGIKTALEAGLPAYAECGGLMYLCRSLAWNGERHEMVGAIPADAVMNARPQGRGYAKVEERPGLPWPKAASGMRGATMLPAHEFHYASLQNLPEETMFAYDVKRGAGVDGRHDGIVIGNLLANFMHLRDTAANHWTARFAAFVRANK